MKLQSIHEKAGMAIGATKFYRQFIRHPGALWYHAIALFNAFYSLTEELKMAQNTKDDPILVQEVQTWRTTNAATLQSFFGTARNTATHQGAVFVEGHQEWEEDIANDTRHPIQRANITVSSSDINDMAEDEFFDLCRKAIEFVQQGVVDIDAAYGAAGGTKHRLVDKNADLDYSEVFDI